MNTLSISLLAVLLLTLAGCGEKAGEKAAGNKTEAVAPAKTEKQLSTEVKSEEKHAEWKQQAEAGDAKGQYLLGVMYAIGDGVPKDAAKAAEWQQKAAAQGNADAQYILGFMYGEGQGVPKNYVLAHMWTNIAVTSATGSKEQKEFIKLRDSLAENMTAQQLAEAQELARKCTANKFKGC
jgi:TPR repeat protein